MDKGTDNIALKIMSLYFPPKHRGLGLLTRVASQNSLVDLTATDSS
jgi:hypothetical protein